MRVSRFVGVYPCGYVGIEIFPCVFCLLHCSARFQVQKTAHVIALRITCFLLYVALLLTIISMKSILNLDNTFVSFGNILKVS